MFSFSFAAKRSSRPDRPSVPAVDVHLQRAFLHDHQLLLRMPVQRAGVLAGFSLVTWQWNSSSVAVGASNTMARARLGRRQLRLAPVENRRASLGAVGL